MAKKKKYPGMSYAALFFLLFYIIERSVEGMFFAAEQQAAHMTVSTFVLVLLACLSWYLGRMVAEKKEK